ncbi:MAG: AI-2E family transporter [Lachnospiraceae bacterium]|nr:AI-2E family transporter [Lachnospiraceae bacterium]
MNRKKLRKRPWYSYAVAACIAVTFYVFLSHAPGIWSAIRTFIGYFRPLIIGCVIAYIVNPLSKVIDRYLLRKMKNEKARALLANGLAFFLVICLLVFFVAILVPQLIDSVMMLADNLDDYIKTVTTWLENWSLTSRFDISSLISSSESMLDKLFAYLTENISSILEASANAGKGVIEVGISFILSIYLLANKKNLKTGFKRLLLAIFGDKKVVKIGDFLQKCNSIFNRYIVYNLIDSMIIGVLTAIFMACFGMQYVGLISFVVAVTNLVPTFGPVAGEVVGGLILLMVKPSHALIFVIAELLVQTLDGYVLKPKLFGNSLGVSGMWILIGIIVGGNMFGIIGILLAIPAVAVIDLVYNSFFIPWLERRRAQKDLEAAQDAEKPDPAGPDGPAETAAAAATDGQIPE